MNLDVNDLTAGEGEIADLWTNVQKVVVRHHVRWQTRELAGFVNVHRSLNTLACFKNLERFAEDDWSGS